MPSALARRSMRFARAVWSEPAVAEPPGPMRRDWVLVSAFAAATLLEGLLRPDVPWRVISVSVTAALLFTLPWRRTHPLATTAVAFGSLAVLEGARLVADVPPADLVSGAYVLVLAYACFRWGSGRDAAAGLAIMLVPAVLASAGGAGSIGEAIAGFAFFLATLAIGVAVRFRAANRTRMFEQVKLVEREQLARDLHDTVAHHVSAIAISAQAGIATAREQPGSAVESLRVIEAEAARTLAEMRAMVRTLRHGEPASLAPTPGLTDLTAFAGNGVDGPAVRVDLRYDLRGESALVPPPVATAVYRVAQEAITNARRHARAATAIDVSVEVTDTELVLTVVDDGEPVRGASSVQPGFGLLGMFERASLLGGTCVAEPGPERGWRVSAKLPLGGGVP